MSYKPKWTLAELNEGTNCVQERKGTAVSYIMASRIDYNHYYNLLEPQQRYLSSKLAMKGQSSLLFNGAPLYAVEGMPSGMLVFQDSEGVAIKAVSWREGEIEE